MMRKLLALRSWPWPQRAWGQGYPNRPVRVVVAAATGGPDIVARVVAAQLQAQLGQPFVVENRPGANGIVGADVVAKAPPDGYTLLVYSSGFVINPFIHKSLPYDTEKDFTRSPTSSATAASSSRCILRCRRRTCRSSSRWPASPMPSSLTARQAWATHGIWPWRCSRNDRHAHDAHSVQGWWAGGGGARRRRGAGDAYVARADHAALQERPGACARVHRSQASSLGAGVPTTAEAGLPQYKHDGGWFAMFAPANTPMDIVEKLYREVRTAMQNPGRAREARRPRGGAGGRSAGGVQEVRRGGAARLRRAGAGSPA